MECPNLTWSVVGLVFLSVLATHFILYLLIVFGEEFPTWIEGKFLFLIRLILPDFGYKLINKRNKSMYFIYDFKSLSIYKNERKKKTN